MDLAALPVAKALGLAVSNPQGILILGAHSWARNIALKLKKIGVKVTLVDTNKLNVRLARRVKLNAFNGNLLSKETIKEIDMTGIGRLLCLTSNDEANSLAALYLEEEFGREKCISTSSRGVGRGWAGKLFSRIFA